jgi:hypothetical protein
MVPIWPPKPDPFGDLQPPRRNPPTAVGVATPPPPAGNPRYYDLHVSRRSRFASAFAATVFAASAASVGTLGGAWWAVLGTGLGAVSAIFLYRAVRRVRRIRLGHPSKIAQLRRRFTPKYRRAA